MRSIVSLSSLALVLVALFAAPTLAEESGYSTDLMNDIGQLEEKIVGLAEAIPADKYGWTPSEGVRSVSESLMHAAQANFFFPTTAGIDPPEGIDMGKLEEITSKAEVVSTLKKSFDQIRKMVEATPADKMGETKQMFGQEMTNAGILHAAISHSHEHLGQMIAYARSIGVTPPWSKLFAESPDKSGRLMPAVSLSVESCLRSSDVPWQPTLRIYVASSCRSLLAVELKPLWSFEGVLVVSSLAVWHDDPTVPQSMTSRGGPQPCIE